MVRNLWSRYAAVFYMSLAMLMWALIENVPRYYSQHYSTFQIVWMRYAIHLLLMLVIFGPRRKLSLFATRKAGLQIVRGLLMMGMHLSFIFAVRQISVHATMAGFWIAPLLLLGLSAWRGERAPALYWGVSIAGFITVLVMLRPLSALLHPAGLLSILMALCFVGYMQMTRAMVDEDIQTSLFYTALSVWIVLSALMPVNWVTPNLRDILLFAVIAILGYIGLYGYDKAAELAPTWVSAPFAFVQPVLVLFTDWKLHGAYPGRVSMAAAGLIGIFLLVLLWRKRHERGIANLHFA